MSVKPATLAHSPLAANSVIVSSSQEKKQFIQYMHATTWTERIGDKVWKKLNTLKPGDKIINTQFIVLEKFSTSKTKEGNTVWHMLVADNTAKINASLFDAYGELLQPSDVVRLTGGYCGVFKNVATLYAGKHGKIERIGEFCFPFTDRPDGADNMSRVQWVERGPDQWEQRQGGGK